jgi:hypothetical protein
MKLALLDPETWVCTLLTKTSLETLLSSLDKTPLEPNTVTSALRRRTITHTGLLLHGLILPSWLKTHPLIANFTKPTHSTSNPDTSALTPKEPKLNPSPKLLVLPLE